MSNTLEELKKVLRHDICAWCEFADDKSCVEFREIHPDACARAKDARAEDIYRRFIEPLEKGERQ